MSPIENTWDSLVSTNYLFHTLSRASDSVSEGPRCCSEAELIHHYYFSLGMFCFSGIILPGGRNHPECRRWQEIPRAVGVWRWLLVNVHGDECERKVTEFGEVSSVLSFGRAADTSNPSWLDVYEQGRGKDCLGTFQSVSCVCEGGVTGWYFFKAEHKSCWVFFVVFFFYLCIPLIVAAVVVSATLFLVGDLRLGGAVVFRWGHRVGSLRHLHRFSVNRVGHSHCKVLLGEAGKYREPERDGGVHEGCFLSTNYKTESQRIKRSWEAAQEEDAFYLCIKASNNRNIQINKNTTKLKYLTIFSWAVLYLGSSMGDTLIKNILATNKLFF